MKLRLIEKRREAADGTTSFILCPERPLTWQAGQFLHYVLPHDKADDREDDRYFTIASSPRESNIRLTARFSNGTGSTFKRALQTLQFGATIEVSEPDGEFVLGLGKLSPDQAGRLGAIWGAAAARGEAPPFDEVRLELVGPARPT